MTHRRFVFGDDPKQGGGCPISPPGQDLHNVANSLGRICKRREDPHSHCFGRLLFLRTLIETSDKKERELQREMIMRLPQLFAQQCLKALKFEEKLKDAFKDKPAERVALSHPGDPSSSSKR
jgi:hypothetical protein